MAKKKSTPPRPPGNPGGRTSQKISPTVTVLGPVLKGFTTLPNPPRASIKPRQMDEARALAERLKAREKKAAAERAANAKIIKEQNKKKPLKTGRGATKPVTGASIGDKKKPIIKVTPRGGRGGGVGGVLGTGGLYGNMFKR